MNSAADALKLIFKVNGSGFVDVNPATGSSSGLAYGSQNSGAFSQEVTIGGNNYIIINDTVAGSITLFNRTQNTSNVLSSGVGQVAAISFGNYSTNGTISQATYLVATANGFLREYYLLTGLSTGIAGSLNLISGGSLTSFNYSNGAYLVGSYNPNLGDLGVTQFQIGTITGLTNAAAVPEPATGAILAGGAALALAMYSHRRKVENRPAAATIPRLGPRTHRGLLLRASRHAPLLRTAVVARAPRKAMQAQQPSGHIGCQDSRQLG